MTERKLNTLMILEVTFHLIIIGYKQTMMLGWMFFPFYLTAVKPEWYILLKESSPTLFVMSLIAYYVIYYFLYKLSIYFFRTVRKKVIDFEKEKQQSEN